MSILGLTTTLYNGLHILSISAFVYVLYRFSVSYLKFRRSPLRDLPGPPSLSFLRGSFTDTSEGNGYRLMGQWAREYGNAFVFRSLLSVSTLCIRIARVICCDTQSRSLTDSESVCFGREGAGAYIVVERFRTVKSLAVHTGSSPGKRLGFFVTQFSVRVRNTDTINLDSHTLGLLFSEGTALI